MNDGCKAFQDVPISFFEFSVTQKISLGVKHARIFVNGFLACELFTDIESFLLLFVLFIQKSLISFAYKFPTFS